MGCLSAPKEDPLVVLGRVRNNLMTQIELNRIKIEKKEKNIQDLDNQIKQLENDLKQNQYSYSQINQLENDLKQNQYSYSDTEKKQKARQIMGLKKELLLEEKGLEEARTYNETLNNNKNTIESKMREVKNMETIKQANEALEKLREIETKNAEILQRNVETIIEEQMKREQKIEIMKKVNDDFYGELGFKDEDDYLKNLLGNNGNTGGAPVFY